jgi:hypothetical protein
MLTSSWGKVQRRDTQYGLGAGFKEPVVTGGKTLSAAAWSKRQAGHLSTQSEQSTEA